jgi:hypothetical protein
VAVAAIVYWATEDKNRGDIVSSFAEVSDLWDYDALINKEAAHFHRLILINVT